MMRRTLPLLVLLLTAACLTPDTVPQPRWFRARLTPVETAPMVGNPVELRFNKVVAFEHLRDRICWRKDGVEYGYYELARWTESPSMVVENAVQAAVYGKGRVRRSLRTDTPRLHVVVRAFEEVIEEDGDRVEVELLAILESEDGNAFFHQVFVGGAPVDGTPHSTARELGAVTSHLAGEIAVAVEAALLEWSGPSN